MIQYIHPPVVELVASYKRSESFFFVRLNDEYKTQSMLPFVNAYPPKSIFYGVASFCGEYELFSFVHVIPPLFYLSNMVCERCQ